MCRGEFYFTFCDSRKFHNLHSKLFFANCNSKLQFAIIILVEAARIETAAFDRKARLREQIILTKKK